MDNNYVVLLNGNRIQEGVEVLTPTEYRERLEREIHELLHVNPWDGSVYDEH